MQCSQVDRPSPSAMAESAEGSSAASGEDLERKIRRFIVLLPNDCEDYIDFKDKHDRDVASWIRINGLFSSATWHHAVYESIGDIVRSKCHSVLYSL